MNAQHLSWSHYVDQQHQLRQPTSAVEFDHDALAHELGFMSFGYNDELAAFVKGHQLLISNPKLPELVGIIFLVLEGETVGYQIRICPRCRARVFFRDDAAASKVYDLVARIVKDGVDFSTIHSGDLPGFEAVLGYGKY